MIRLEALLGVVSLALAIYCLIDVIRTPEGAAQHLPKIAWLVLVLLFPLVGSIAWLVAGRPGRAAAPRSTSAFPEYDRPGRMVASDPEADDAFLRQVRARAEEQRRRYREEQRRREQDGV